MRDVLRDGLQNVPMFDGLAFIQTENIHYGLSSRTWLPYQMDVQDDVITVGEYAHDAAMRLYFCLKAAMNWRNPSVPSATWALCCV